MSRERRRRGNSEYETPSLVAFTIAPSAANGTCSTGSSLYQIAASGGVADHLATEAAPGCIVNLAADADGVYWLTADGGQLRALPAR